MRYYITTGRGVISNHRTLAVAKRAAFKHVQKNGKAVDVVHRSVGGEWYKAS